MKYIERKHVLRLLTLLLTSIMFSSFTKADALVKLEKPLYDYPVFSLNLEDFYNQFDYKISGLGKVKAAVEKKDFTKAAKELHAYFIKHKSYAQKVYSISELRSADVKQKEAERLLERTYSFQGATHTFSNGIDWLYNPTVKEGKEVNPEWVVNTVRFRVLPEIVSAYRKTNDERFASEAVYLMRDFIEKFPVPLNEKQDSRIPVEIDWLVYSKLSVSARLNATILGLFSVIESPSLSSKDFVTILQGINNHLLRMEKYPYLGYHNMGVVDAQVLQKASVAIPELKKSTEWAKWALERGLDQMEHVVYPDGVEKELCPRYHQGVMGSFAQFMAVSQSAGISAPKAFTEKLKSMGEFLVKISRPDGTIPAFNEMIQAHGDSKDIRKKIRGISRAINDNGVLNWFGSSGTGGTKPQYNSVALNWAGYYVMRSGWAKNDNYMVIKAGPYGAAHQQEDKLSFELFANGELFLIDPGFYLYNKKSLWRKYYQSSLAHNTVVPDRLSQYRYGQRNLYENNKPNDATWISNTKYDFLSATYENGYAEYRYITEKNPNPLVKIRHQRDVLFIKPGVWLVLDWLDPEDTKEHSYEALFQSEFKFQVNKDNLILEGKKSNLQILPVPGKENALEASVASGQTEPLKRGWIYKIEGEKNTPISTGVINQKSKGKTAQAYFIIPGEKNASDIYQVKMITVEGGVGAKLFGPNGLSISFIAQQQAGKVISGAGLTTSGRIKVNFDSTGEKFEIVK
ncbi:alginate lyase family protein [Pedobacter sp. ASV1-7]|uniref:alginate lyase family protein n=1 Tax=Pedobacter sp. ASV1-7 TaxID=3145237 RepID=UPI0032E86E52